MNKKRGLPAVLTNRLVVFLISFTAAASLTWLVVMALRQELFEILIRLVS